MLGTAFISERFNVKEAATLSGAAGAVTEHLGLATGATNHNTRHPIVTASYATTMHRLTGGRFALGLARGIKFQFDAFGLPPITTAQLEDFVGLNLGHMQASADGKYVYFPWMNYRHRPITAGNIRQGWVLASRIARVRLDGPARREAIALTIAPV